MVKLRFIILSLFLSSINVFSVFTNVKLDSIRIFESELLRKLKNTQSFHEKYTIYRELSNLYYSEKKEIDYLIEIINLAYQNKDVKVVFKSYEEICRNYYNRGNIDSLKFWVDYTSPLLLDYRYYNIYFENLNYLSHLYVNKGKLKDALSAVTELQINAFELNNIKGEIMSYELLGIINSKTGNSEEAIDNYINAYNLNLKHIDNDMIKLNILSRLIIEYIEVSNYSFARSYTDEYERILTKCISLENKPHYFERELLLLHSFYIEIFVGMGDIETASRYIKLSNELNNVDDVFVSNYFQHASALYYKSTGDYSVAMNVIGDLEYNKSNRKNIILKGDILREKGDYKSASFYYKNAYESLLAEFKSDMARDFNELKINSDIDRLISKNNTLKLQEQEARSNSFLILSIFMCITMVVFLLFYLREKILKNQLLISEYNLQLDKKSLIKTKQELEIACQKAEESNILKSTFLANMSHEIRTPLNSIVGFSEMLGESDYNPEMMKEFASIIKTNSDSLLKLVNDIFDISKMDSGSLSLEFTMYDINIAAYNALNVIEEQVENGVTLTFNMPKEPVIVNTDSARVQQILINILSNSCKFTKQGNIDLTVTKDDYWVHFIITDTGCGVPENMQLKIFERFHKVNEYTQGTGLGLSICKILSDMLGGKLELDKNYNEGARFIFSHPICAK